MADAVSREIPADFRLIPGIYQLFVQISWLNFETKGSNEGIQSETTGEGENAGWVIQKVRFSIYEM
jgi:hypothetical protein